LRKKITIINLGPYNQKVHQVSTMMLYS